MSTIDQAVAAAGTALPDVITGHIGGKSVPVDTSAKHLGVYFPGTGEQIASLQEDDARAVATAVSAARESFKRGAWSGASTGTRQTVFRTAAQLIRDHAEELAVLECVCAGLPSSHLASRQVPRAADNLDFFADYIGVMAGETFEQLPGYQTVVTRQPAGVA
ncbi:MAG: aldehyde dehydrogenase family protein, partial [Luminiphilus sp.]